MKRKILNYVDSIREYLAQRYGGVSPEWETMLMLLSDNLELYNECRESVKKNGIYNSERGIKNPLLSTMKDLQATIIKQVQHFGLSPYSASKLHSMAEDDTDGFIEGLVE